MVTSASPRSLDQWHYSALRSKREVHVETLDATGSFWFPDSEKVALFGNLVFDPADGTTITLAGGLSELRPNGELHEAWGGERVRIFGEIDRGSHRVKVTLI